MATLLDYPHNSDTKKWNQDDTEQHQAALSGDQICYFCLASLNKKDPEELREAMANLRHKGKREDRLDGYSQDAKDQIPW